jgi:plasmid stabilization system protein ParE
VERWVIFYRVEGTTVEVHRIIDGARDLDSLLE